MPRLLFEKKGNAVWISHLDLMRLFQRAFKRAGLQLKHTQGFNPRPSVSIALPLSVGVESGCELLDFDLDGKPVSCDDICSRLNSCLVDGVTVLKVYDEGRKIRDLALLKCHISLDYDNGIPENALCAINNLFEQQALIVRKKTKRGFQDQNIIPMIRRFSIVKAGEKRLLIDTVVCCQNPTLNPMQLPLAIREYLPEVSPDFSQCCRVEIYDNEENIFR